MEHAEEGAGVAVVTVERVDDAGPLGLAQHPRERRNGYAVRLRFGDERALGSHRLALQVVAQAAPDACVFELLLVDARALHLEPCAVAPAPVRVGVALGLLGRPCALAFALAPLDVRVAHALRVARTSMSAGACPA